MHLSRFKYVRATKKNSEVVTGKVKFTRCVDRAKSDILLIKVDDELERTFLFVRRILQSFRFNLIHVLVKYGDLILVEDYDKLLNILCVSGYKFNLSFVASDNYKNEEFVNLYTIEKINSGCYYG
ncbi:hypothetical protein GVAV_003322 [Gurleya vavrai]